MGDDPRTRSTLSTPVARAIELSLIAARWERSADRASDLDDRFSRRLQAEISRLRSAAALGDLSG